MIDIDGIKQMFTDRIKDYAVENECKATEVVALIFHANGQVEINLYIKNKFVRKLHIQRDILRLKLDVLGKAAAAGFIFGILLNMFMQELKERHGECEKEDVRVQIFTEKEEPIVPRLQLYKEGDTTGGRFVEWEEFNQLA